MVRFSSIANVESIQEIGQQIKNRGEDAIHEWGLVAIVFLVALASFGLGRLSKIEGAKTPIRIENAPEVTADTFKPLDGAKKVSNNIAQTANIIGATTGQLVASKSGKKYYYPWCTGVQKIKEENRIYFASKTEAEARGYTPSATCKGL